MLAGRVPTGIFKTFGTDVLGVQPITAIAATGTATFTLAAAATSTSTTTSGSPNLTVVSPTTGWANGMAVVGAGIPVGTTILSGAGTATMVMSANATASAAGVAITGSVDRTIPAGAQLDVEGIGFETVADLVVPAASSTGTVNIVAIDAGVAGNGVQTPATLVSPTLIFVNSVALPAPTDGGVDDEDDDQYVDRLADTTPTLSRKAILIDDFAALARDDAEVFRALAIDNLNPAAATGTATTTSGSPNLTLVTPTTTWANGMTLHGTGIPAGTTILSGAGTATMVMSANATASAAGVAITGDDTNAEGHVTIIAQNEAGAAISPAGKARVLASLQANRVLNLVPHVLDPTFTSVDISATVTAYAGQDTAAVDTAATAAIVDFLNAARWGNPPGADQFAWVEETKLRRDDLVWVVHNTPGVRRVDSLTLALHGGSLATADLTIAGPGAIPVLFAGQPNVTVNPS